MGEVRLIDANAFKQQAAIETVRQGLNVEKIVLFFALIDAQATVDAEIVRHARWVNESYIGEGEAHFNCSKCGAGETHRLDVPVPYCWKCGAKMDEEEKNDA